MPEVIRAWLLTLGFKEVESEHSCSGVEYRRGELAAYQTSAGCWCVDAPDDEALQGEIAAMAAADTFEHTLGVVLDSIK